MKVVILIVIYNKEVRDSSTFRTLILNGVHDLHIVIHNNGPEIIYLPPEIVSELELLNVTITLNNCIQNMPLACLYNEFIDFYADYDKFVLLDDDSTLTTSYMNSLYNNDYDIELPKIVSVVDGKTYYPISRDLVCINDDYLDPSTTISIGSGIIITRSFLEKFSKKGLKIFDEKYAFYGVDSSLFRRMWKLKREGQDFRIKSSSTIIHSLSRTEGPESIFRKNERLMDFAITMRHYPSFSGYLSLLKKGLKQLVTLKMKDFILMFRCFFSGIHPRSKIWSDSKRRQSK